ncbi:spermine oxidase-like [Babylonia areolata]|uniref:spermine oxidase-like n=1 Tax=Babylonia areolata TaxID=304850 RepID=UPI003FD07C67
MDFSCEDKEMPAQIPSPAEQMQEKRGGGGGGGGGGGSKGPRVVVIGAGIAGVGAVGLLREGGIHDITLLEATGRPGGRVETRQLENGFFELGAQFLHGKNEVYNIAEREKMLVEQEPGEDSQPDTPLQFRDFVFRTSDGEPVNPDTVINNLQVLEDLQLSANEALRQGRAGDINVSVGQFFRSQYHTASTAMLGSEGLKNAMFRWLEYWDCQDCGGTVDQLSLPGNGQYVFYPGNGTRETTRGMEAVFQVLLKECVPPECLLLNKAVRAVQWTPQKPSFSSSAASSSQRTATKTPAGDGPARSEEGSSYGLNNNLIDGGNNLELKKTAAKEPRDTAADAREREGDCERTRTNKRVADAIKNDVGSFENAPEKNYDDGEERSFRTSNADANNKQPSSSSNKYDKDDDSDVGRTTKPPSSWSSNNSSRGNINSEEEEVVGAGGVRIECEDGDVFHADHVIVTSSMGFLTSNPGFFVPELPREHQHAIRSMGFGNVAKVGLFWDPEDVVTQVEGSRRRREEEEEDQGCAHYSSSSSSSSSTSVENGASGWERYILGSDTEGMIPLWLEGADVAMKSARYCKPMSNGRQWYQEVCIYQALQSHDLCVVAWLGGECATVMESLPEAEVKDVLHELLTRFLANPDLPAPRRLIRTGWYSNPYTRGAYSFLATGVPLELHEVLSLPLPSPQSPALQLAGEACSKRYYSTAHGALESGQDAARAILRHHKLLPTSHL